jgi:hypothetical protein
MVHALEITHGLLKEGGLLIDIHPTGDPPRIEAHVGGEVRLAGHLDETDGFVEYFNADDALVEVIRRGLFVFEREGLFTFKTHAPTIKELVEFIKAEWSDSVVHEETIERAAKLMGEPGEDREIVLREKARIARFRANRSLSTL